MKRSELILRIRTAARGADLTWEFVRQGSAHEVWRLGERRVTIPRHREINEVTAMAVMRLTQVESMARDAIALFLEVPADSFDLSVREKLTPEAERLVAAAKEARAAAIAHQEVASERSRAAARTLTEQGLPQRDIGRLLDLSHQRVAQLLEVASDGPRAHRSNPGGAARRR